MQPRDHGEQTDHENRRGQGSASPGSGLKAFIVNYGPAIVGAVFICYVILLGIGVAAEVFKIQWILDWWIWSPPGKFR